MSKSISGGLGTVNLTIGELRLLGATFDDFNSTNGTITGTLNVNNIIISGTFSLTDLELTGQLTTPVVNSTTINNTGTITTNDIIINNEIEINQAQATADNDFKLMFLNASDYVRVSQTNFPLTFNPSSGLLKSSNLTLTDVFEIKQQTNPANRLISIEEESGNNGVCYIRGPVANYGYNIGIWNNDHIRFQCSQFYRFYVDGNEVCQMTNNFLRFYRNFRMENNSQFQLQDDDPTTNGDKGILLWNQNVNNISVTKIRLTGYQDVNGDWELHFDITAAGDRIKMTATGVQIYTTTYTDDADLPLFFGEPTTGSLYEISKDDHLTYNPSTNKLITGNLELTDDLTVTGSTNLGNNVSVNALNGVLSNTVYRILLWDNTATLGSRVICADFTNLYYDTTTNTLYTPSINVNSFTSLTVTGNTDLQGDTTINAITATSTDNNNSRIMFIEGNGTTSGRISNFGGLYFNPSSGTLVAPTMRATTATTTPEINILGTNNAQLFVDNTYGLFLNHPSSFVFRMSQSWKIYISSSRVTIYDNLYVGTNFELDGDFEKETKTLSAANRNMNLLFHDFDTYDKRIKEQDLLYYNPSSEKLFVQNITLTESNPTVAQIQNVISFDNVGFIRGQRSSTLDPQLSMRNNSANTGFQIQLNPTTTYFNAPPSGLHRFYIDNGTSLDVKMEINTNQTIINNELKLNNVSNTTGTGNKLLVLDINDNVEKTDITNFGVSVFTGNEFISTEEIITDTIRLNGLPLNYTENYYINSWTTDTGTFGGGRYIQINNQNGVLKQYGDFTNPAGGIFSFKGNTGNVSSWGFTNSAYNGLYEIKITALYQNDLTGANDRVNPRMRLYRFTSPSLTIEEQLHPITPYIRNALAKVASFGLVGKIYLQANDTFRVSTLLNISGSSNFTSTTTSYTGTYFSISLTYLGNLTETVS